MRVVDEKPEVSAWAGDRTMPEPLPAEHEVEGTAERCQPVTLERPLALLSFSSMIVGDRASRRSVDRVLDTKKGLSRC